MNILDLLFPRRCVSCGRVGKYLCHKCVSMIRIIEANHQVCPVCERPAIDGKTHPRCQTKYSLDGLTSFFVYDGPIKKAIKLLKYKFVTDLAKELISLIEENSPQPSLAKRGGNKAEPSPKRRGQGEVILTPVPLHWRRLNWRGFNQSEVLGRLISARLDIKFVPDLLIRKKYTQPQVELEKDERQENIKDAFMINPRYRQILNKQGFSSSKQSFSSNTKYQILIFDDVWTTGATLKTCGQVLKEAGAKKVWGMTLAR